MTNEEKILELLHQVIDEQAEMRGKQTSMEESLSRAIRVQESMEESLARVIRVQESMEETLTRVAVTQENVVLPRLQLLAEGHNTIQEQIKRLSVIDSLQDDVATLKSAVRFLSQKLDQLEKAM